LRRPHFIVPASQNSALVSPETSVAAAAFAEGRLGTEFTTNPACIKNFRFPQSQEAERIVDVLLRGDDAQFLNLKTSAIEK